MNFDPTGAGDLSILELIANMNRRLQLLEEANHFSKAAYFPIPAGARTNGANYSKRGKVQFECTSTDDSQQTRIHGSVTASFGFVHHPQVCVCRIDGELIVNEFSCDCQDFTNGNFCAHCAALIHAVHGPEMVKILPGSASNNEAADQISNRQNGIRSIDIVEDYDDQNGNRIVCGKAVCNFHFIHRPSLTLSPNGSVLSYSCTCSMQDDRMCPHCRALKQVIPTRELPASDLEDEQLQTIDDLYDLFSEEEIAFDAAEETPSVPEDVPADDGAPRLMRIRFGTDAASGAPVCWFPNDTSHVTHINLGIIGTMGTGKTQFTKSVVTQLYRQKDQNLYAGKGLGILIFDYKGDYNESHPDFVNATNARVLKVHKLPFNPFSLAGFKHKPQLHVHTAMAFADTLTQIYGLGAIQKNTLVQTILTAYNDCGITEDPLTWSKPAPTFAQIYETYLARSKSQRNDSLAVALDTLAYLQVFEPDPANTIPLFELLQDTVVIDLTGHTESVQHLIVAITLELFYSQMLNSPHSKLVTTPEGGVYRQLQKVILVDEADNIMARGIPVLKSIMKEAREFGIGVILSTQFLDHFHTEKEDYRKYMKTWVVHNVESLKKSDLEYVFQIPAQDPISEQLYHDVKHLEKHHSVIRIGTGDPVYAQDLAFYQISDDDSESYLLMPQEDADNQPLMPEEDAENLPLTPEEDAENQQPLTPEEDIKNLPLTPEEDDQEES